MPTGVGEAGAGRPAVSSAPRIEPMVFPSMFGAIRAVWRRPGAITAPARRACATSVDSRSRSSPITMAVALIVIAAVMGFIVVALHQWQSKEERVTSIDESRNALQRIVAELRDANPITVVNGQHGRRHDPQRRYHAGRPLRCAAPAHLHCSRPPSATGETVQLATGVTNTDIFTRVSDSAVAGADTHRPGGPRQVRDPARRRREPDRPPVLGLSAQLHADPVAPRS